MPTSAKVPLSHVSVWPRVWSMQHAHITHKHTHNRRHPLNHVIATKCMSQSSDARTEWNINSFFFTALNYVYFVSTARRRRHWCLDLGLVICIVREGVATSDAPIVACDEQKHRITTTTTTTEITNTFVSLSRNVSSFHAFIARTCFIVYFIFLVAVLLSLLFSMCEHLSPCSSDIGAADHHIRNNREHMIRWKLPTIDMNK